jgi:glycosyltransferase involved in cell wall biosynthesis
MIVPVDDIWFWQDVVSPHMAGLALSLAREGCKVTYVAEQELSVDRVKLGWQAPQMNGVHLRFAANNEAIRATARQAAASSVHICQGIRGNGLVTVAQHTLSRRGSRQWVVMETVDDAGVWGIAKRLEYDRLFRGKARLLDGVLAIGHRTMDWIIARGMEAERVYPFAYFLPQTDNRDHAVYREVGSFRFLFVGQFIERKRLDLLIHNLAKLLDRGFELLVVGVGPEERQLRILAESTLPGRVRWLGRRPQAEVPAIMSQADCLVLPSRHDGWGAAISEALMVGTPVICSDACGAAGAVKASKTGGVFASNRDDELRLRLDEQLKSGPISTGDRLRLASWASALGAEAGAQYLMKILDYSDNGGSRPMPPWHTEEI